jgi:tetratricopeptide (TPR) repeat protein
MLKRLIPFALVAVVVACGRTEPTPVSTPVTPQPAPPGWEETKARGEELRYQTGMGPEAVALLQKVVDAVPGFPDGHFELAAAHWEEASRDYGGAMSERRPRFEKAIEHFRRAIELGYQPRGDAREQIAQVQVRMMRFDDAEKEGRAWAAEEPGDPAAWWMVAGAVVAQDRAQEGARLMLDAGPKIGASGQVEYAQFLTWIADLPPMSREDRQALLDAAQAIVDQEVAAQRVSSDLLLVHAKVLSTRAEHLEQDPARQRELQAEADRLIAQATR